METARVIVQEGVSKAGETAEEGGRDNPQGGGWACREDGIQDTEQR